MKKQINLSQVERLVLAHESSVGTNDNRKYATQNEAKIGNKWCFMGWYRPCLVATNYYLKEIKCNTYLYAESNNDCQRYLLSNDCLEVLGA